jgi:integrase
MATIQNRSRFRITVKNNAGLTREFSYNRLPAVEAYMADLRQRGCKPRVEQLADCFEVRIRQRGYAPICMTFGSEFEAANFVKRVEEERNRGLFVDYTKAHNVTLAELLVRFLRAESSTRRSYALESYKIEGWLEDSGPAGQALLHAYRDELRKQGMTVRPAKFKMRDSVTHIAWIHKRLTEVTTEDIECFKNDRLDDVQPSTVDRELDILSAVFKVVTKVWGYRLHENPMDGVRRPRYYNERDRRLVGNEEERLLTAARAEDRTRCGEECLQRLIDRTLEGSSFPNASARKRARAAAAHRLRAQSLATCPVVPLLEAFVQFQLMTAARRGETLSLTWDHIDFDAQTAFLPFTKNGRPRKLPLRSDLLDLLEQLPRDDPRVFPVSADTLAGAWQRICATANIVDLLVHDLRHEGISRVAELGDGTPGSGFGLVELQAFSGHRDTRMLLRYAHLCASRMAWRLDDAFSKAPIHKGRRRLGKDSTVKMSALTNQSMAVAEGDSHVRVDRRDDARVSMRASPAPEPLPDNVIPFRAPRQTA